MGRTLKRVPLDFDWPFNKVWEGYLTPERYNFPTCSDCDGEGYSREARAVANTFYRHQIGGPCAEELAWCDKIGQAEVDNLLEKGRLRTWVDGEWRSLPRTATEINEINRSSRGLDWHDAINRSILIRFRCERLGITLLCSTCNGHGSIASDEEREAADAWESSEPPEGEGYQLWETTSEGSPISPVFATLDELCQYAASNCSVFGGSITTAAKWKQMLSDDFVAIEEVAADRTRIMFL